MRSLLIASVFFYTSIAVHAAINLSSLGITQIDPGLTISYNTWEASEIKSDDEETTSDLIVDAISLRIRTDVPNANLFVGIVAATTAGFRPDMNNIVTSMDVTPLIVDPVLSMTSIVRLTPKTEFLGAVLTAGQNYWLVLGATDVDVEQTIQTGRYFWSYTGASAPTEAPAGWAVSSVVASAGTAGQDWEPSTLTPASFEIEVTPVPEPAAYAIIFGLISLLIAFKRRNHSSAH